MHSPALIETHNIAIFTYTYSDALAYARSDVASL